MTNQGKACIILLVTICNYLFLSPIRRVGERFFPKTLLEGRDLCVDQLLLYPKPSILTPAPPKVKERTRRAGLTLPRLPHIALPNFLERRSLLDPVIFLTLALSLCAAGILGSLYGPSYQVAVDGVDMGLVENYQDVNDAIARVEDRASDILGYSYTLHQDVEYEFKVSLKEDRAPVAKIETYLFDQIGEVMKTSVLTVNGKMLGATDDAYALSLLLDSIKAPYINDDTVECEFVEDVAVTREYTATSAIKEISSMERILTSNTVEKGVYTVVSGDTYSDIAARFNMTVDELLALNPSASINSLMPGDVLTVRQAVPYLSVRTVDHLIYDDVVPYETEYVDDSNLYEGWTEVRTTGVDGTATYTANVTYVNGVEKGREIMATQILEAPVTQVIARGTKPRPKTVASGRFIWPLSGPVTSGFGSRYIFGSYSFHSGIDIYAAYGTGIAAVDGGKVVYAGAGTGANWSLGNYVTIDHENGLQTVYAHCSSIYVNVGDRVFQGQTIAAVGTSGRVTGPHCHFTVRENNVIVNPYNYLP